MVKEALRRGIYAGTKEFEQLVDFARFFGIEVRTIKIRTNLETGEREETPATFPPPERAE